MVVNVATGAVRQLIDYDAKGNITYDRTNNAQLQEYTYFNLPLKIVKGSYVTNYSYNNTGARICKQNDNTEEYYLYDYTGKPLPVINYKTPEKSLANIYGNGVIGQIEDVYGDAPERYYYVKDHLGSIRLTLKKVGSTMTVDNARDYYPYGEVMRNYQNGDPTVNYMFTEKERDAEIESGYDYFGARYYNSKLGMWLQVDPLAEKYPGWSPYNYTVNNPMKFIDPNGAEYSPIYDTDGNYLGTDDEGFHGEILVFKDKSKYKRGMKHSDATKIGDKFSQTLGLTNNAESKIIKSVIQGIEFPDGNIFDASKYEYSVGKASPNATFGSDPNSEKITIDFSFETYEWTVENLRNVAVHEAYGHGVLCEGEYGAYKSQMDSKYWNGTTPSLKSHVVDRFFAAIQAQGSSNMSMKYYKEYIKWIK